jgi:hypothetical protein
VNSSLSAEGAAIQLPSPEPLCEIGNPDVGAIGV